MTGEGEYSVAVDCTKADASGIGYAVIVIENGENELSGSFIQVTDIRVSGETVDYNNNLTILSECVKWFDSIDEVTTEFCVEAQSELAFGELMSKAELGNIGYLFICNRLTYCQPIADNSIYLPRYHHDHVMWEEYRAKLDAMVAELEPIGAESSETEGIESPEAGKIEEPEAEENAAE